MPKQSHQILPQL